MVTKMKKVNVVVVTYNRRNCLLKLLDGLKDQTYPIESVIIVDNHSTDDTNTYLEKKGYINSISDGETSIKISNGIRFVYYRNYINTGGSGGFAKSFEIAMNYNCDYLWIMDDDVLPERDCLKKLINSISDDAQAVIPNRTDENYSDRVCVELDLKCTTKFSIMRRKTFVKHPLVEQSYYVKDFPFEGPLISFEIVKQVGLPCADYFILCDDTDYAIRVQQYTKIKFVTSAILHRQLAKKKTNENKTFTWRDYYAIRNSILIQKKYGTTFGARYISPIIAWNWWFVLSVYKRRFKNLRILNMAVRDGLNNRWGKFVNPGDF